MTTQHHTHHIGSKTAQDAGTTATTERTTACHLAKQGHTSAATVAGDARSAEEEQTHEGPDEESTDGASRAKIELRKMAAA